MASHDLKVWPDYFDAVASGGKKFELRKDDRGFHVGDTLRLREYSPGPNEYTGRECSAVISYILHSDSIPFGAAALKPGYCVISLSLED